jgi:hypothetical protein
VICIQEHWLFNFEQSNIENVHPDYNFAAKSTDDMDPIPEVQRPRGFGGVCTLWRKDLQGLPIPDGTERTLVVQVEGVTVINTYLPCRGKYTDEEVKDEIDQINEVCAKFQETKIVLAGDLNIDLTKQNTKRTQYLRDLISNHNLKEPTVQPFPTYYHHDDKATSKIDYIYINWICKEPEYKILEKDSMNTSPHLPLIAIIPHRRDAATTPIGTEKRTLYKWHKCDTSQYQDLLDKYLNVKDPPVDVNEAIQYLIKVLTLATDAAVPKKRMAQNNTPKPWNEEIKQLFQEGKLIDCEWKKEGSPGPGHKLYDRRKEIRKQVRSAQRIQTAIHRETNLRSIMEAQTTDQAMFFRLIRQQRKTPRDLTLELTVDNKTHKGNLLPVWTQHFKALATPKAAANYIDDYNIQVRSDVSRISDICNADTAETIPITTWEVNRAIAKLKNKKAQDEFGIKAEHLKLAGAAVPTFLTNVFNQIISNGSVPEILQNGIIHPVFKKKNPRCDPGNYRGITITPIVGKLLDIILASHQRAAIPEDKQDLQFGFTKGKAPAHATLMVTEVLAEARDVKQPTYIANLDVVKAFDVVTHASLLRKLHTQGLKGKWWCLKKSSYDDMTGSVTWRGKQGDRFKIYQGNRQGGIASTQDFKVYIGDLLELLLNSEFGAHIGSQCLGVIACADDLILLAPTEAEMNMQTLLTTSYANLERFEIHPSKSTISIAGLNSLETKFFTDLQPWHINNNPLPVTSNFTHLGVDHETTKASATATCTVEARLKSARNATYALMGAGLHGVNGINPRVSIHIYNIYVLPRLLYNLEVIDINETNLKRLEVAHRRFLRNIQSLPTRTATPALYILTGVLPIEAQIDQRRLCMIPSLAENPTILTLLTRQIAMKDGKSHSWIVKTQDALHKYKLPTLLQVIIEQVDRLKWKSLVKTAISSHWKKQIEKEATVKSTLSRLNPMFDPKKTHPLWSTTSNCPRDVRKAIVKAKLLTETYTLQYNKAIFNQTRNATCTLCQGADENPAHFLLDCPVFQNDREGGLKQTLQGIPLVYQDHPIQGWETTDLVQLLLDATHPTVAKRLPLQKEDLQILEKGSRNLVYRLHTRRALLLGYRT